MQGKQTDARRRGCNCKSPAAERGLLHANSAPLSTPAAVRASELTAAPGGLGAGGSKVAQAAVQALDHGAAPGHGRQGGRLSASSSGGELRAAGGGEAPRLTNMPTNQAIDARRERCLHQRAGQCAPAMRQQSRQHPCLPACPTLPVGEVAPPNSSRNCGSANMSSPDSARATRVRSSPSSECSSSCCARWATWAELFSAKHGGGAHAAGQGVRRVQTWLVLRCVHPAKVHIPAKSASGSRAAGPATHPTAQPGGAAARGNAQARAAPARSSGAASAPT